MGFTLLASHHRKFLRDYGGALLNTPQIFRRLAFRRRTLEEELQEALLRGSLRKSFSGFDLLMLGLGILIGSGWAQLTGTAAQQFSGAAIILSYIFAGLAALLAAACYAELCVEYPVSGGAFSYVMVTFGELAAFVALSGLLLEYALGMAAVARGFSANFAALINMAPQDVRVWVDEAGDGHSFDPIACAIVLIISVLLSLGVRESATFISGMTVVKMALVLVVAIVGYAHSSWSNPDALPFNHWNPFFVPAWDTDGIFVGASVIFFTYTGFDAIGNAAEEVQNVAHLPWAILGTVLVAMLAYFMLALSLVLLVWPNIACPSCVFIPDFTPRLVNFISAFVGGHGLKCMQYVVSLTALFGIVTALTVGLFSASRIVMVASRDWLLPPFLARISRRTQTPLVAQMVLGVIIALLAFAVEVDASTAMVSFGTLVALWLVCNAQMYRRYSPDVQMRFTRYGTVETAPKQDLHSRALGRALSPRMRKALLWAHIVAINGVTIALSIYYEITTSQVSIPDNYCQAPPGGAAPAPTTAEVDPQQAGPATTASSPWLEACDPTDPNISHGFAPIYFLVAWAALTLSFQLCCPLEYEPAGWHIPYWLMPWLPSAAIVLVVFSVGGLQGQWWKTGAYFGLVLVFYLLFSLPMSYIKHSRVDYAGNTEELNIIELAFIDGRWQPAQLPCAFPPLATGAAASGPRGSAASKVDMAGLKSGLPSGGPVAGKLAANGAGYLSPHGSTAQGSTLGSSSSAGTAGSRPGSVTRQGGRGRGGGRDSRGSGRGRGGSPGRRGPGSGGQAAAARRLSQHSPHGLLPPTHEEREGEGAA